MTNTSYSITRLLKLFKGRICFLIQGPSGRINTSLWGGHRSVFYRLPESPWSTPAQVRQILRLSGQQRASAQPHVILPAPGPGLTALLCVCPSPDLALPIGRRLGGTYELHRRVGATVQRHHFQRSSRETPFPSSKNQPLKKLLKGSHR